MELTPAEGKSLTHDASALDSIAIVVNNDNKASQVSIAELADVFSVKLTTWDKIK